MCQYGWHNLVSLSQSRTYRAFGGFFAMGDGHQVLLCAKLRTALFAYDSNLFTRKHSFYMDWFL